MIALFTALLAPLFVDWTSHRAAFEREASRIIGQPVKVSGRASMRILPLPTVTFSDISVGQYEDGTPMMTAGSFSMDAELMPFLRGEVRIVDMRLEGPHAIIRVNENGTIDWTRRKEALVDPGKVLLERMVVTGASFEIEGLAGGRRITGQAFDAEISAQTLAGPWRITADGEVDGVASQFSIITGRLQEEGSLRVSLEGRRLDHPYRLALDGPVEVNEGIIGWKGAFGISPALTKEGKPDAGALPVLVSGMFAATPDAVDVPEYRLEIGGRQDPYTITGKGRAQIREEIAFRIEADGRQIDLDRLPDAAAQGSNPAANLATRLAALRRIADAVPVPQARGEIDFELPAIVAGDTVIREVSALLRPDGDGWQVARLRATLPGNTTMEASGRLGTGAQYGFAGKLLLASRQPTGFANWLSGGSDASLRRLKNAGFSADVVLTPEKTLFDDLELVLDGVAINGSVHRETNAGGAPSLIAVLEGEEIDLQDLRAMQALTGEEAGGGIAGHDLDLTLKTALLRADGLEAGDVDMQLRVAKGSVSVERLNVGDFHGARIESSGKLNDLLGRASGNLGLKVVAQDGSGLVELARERLGENRFLDALAVDPALVGGVDVAVSIDARPEGEGAKGTITASGEIGGARFDLRDEFTGQPGRWGEGSHGLTAKISHDAPDVLARQFSLPALPLPPDGPVTIDLELSGKPLEKMEGLLALGAPGADFSATGTLAFAPAVASATPDFSRPEYSAAVTLGVRDADPWFFMFGQGFPGAGEGTPLSLSAQASGTGENHEFRALKGQVAGNGFTGELTLAMPAGSRPKLAGKLDLDTLSLPVLAEFVTGSGTFGTQSFDNSISEVEFQAPPFTSLDGEVALSARKFETGFGEPATEFSTQAALLEGAMSLAQVSANWLGGQFTGAMSLKNVEGSANASLQGNLSGFDATLAMTTVGHAPVLSGVGDAGFSLDTQGRSLKALVANLAGSGTIAMREFAVNGVRLGALGEILPEADAQGFEVNAQNVVPLAERMTGGGKLEIGELTGTFTVSSGKVAIRNVGADLAGGRAEGEASADLSSGAASARLTLKVDPGKEALAGAEPAVTFNFAGVPGAMERTADTAALEGWLALRAFEQEQRRVEVLQASVLQKQRLRREIIAANARAAMREQERQAELQRLEELQRRLEAERIAREKAARKAAEEEAARKAAAEEAARKAAAEEAARKAAEEEAARKAAAEEAARKAAAEKAARKAAEEEAARKAAEEEAARQQILNEAVPKTNGSKAGITVQDLPRPPAEIAPAQPQPRSKTLFENLDELFQ